MKKQEEKTINEINIFDEEASIYKIPFQDRATTLLKYIIDKISIDRFENVDFKLPSILIAGKEGKQLLGKVFSTALCSSFEQVQGKHLGMGGYCGSLYNNVDSEIVYFISSADKISAYSVSLFHQYLSQGFIKFRNHLSGEERTVSAENKLFIFSVNDSKKLCSDLYKAIDFHCYLKNYNTKELELIVDIRLKWSGVNYEKEVPAIIVHNSQGSISSCIRLLSVCYLVMRGDCRNKMTVKDLEIGIGLNNPQGGLVPPPIDDDIPF